MLERLRVPAKTSEKSDYKNNSQATLEVLDATLDLLAGKNQDAKLRVIFPVLVPHSQGGYENDITEEMLSVGQLRDRLLEIRKGVEEEIKSGDIRFGDLNFLETHGLPSGWEEVSE